MPKDIRNPRCEFVRDAKSIAESLIRLLIWLNYRYFRKSTSAAWHHNSILPNVWGVFHCKGDYLVRGHEISWGSYAVNSNLLSFSKCHYSIINFTYWLQEHKCCSQKIASASFYVIAYCAQFEVHCHKAALRFDYWQQLH